MVFLVRPARHGLVEDISQVIKEVIHLFLSILGRDHLHSGSLADTGHIWPFAGSDCSAELGGGKGPAGDGAGVGGLSPQLHLLRY